MTPPTIDDTIADMIAAVAAAHGVGERDILGRSRLAVVVRARKAAMRAVAAANGGTIPRQAIATAFGVSRQFLHRVLSEAAKHPRKKVQK